MRTQIDRAAEGAALGPLSREEKTRLVLLAREAYGKTRDQRPETTDQRPQTTDRSAERRAFDEWRRRQVLMCVERSGLRECRHEDYGYVRAHFLRLLGREGAAERAQVRAACEPRRQALAKLRREMDAARDVIENPAAYVGAIARARYKTTALEELGEKQLWGLVFDLRRNAARRRRRGAAGTGAEGEVPF